MTDPSRPKGEARAQGTSIADVLASDAYPPPAPLTASQYAFLGDTDLPASRYTCPRFFKEELTDMWSKCWQWACREEHIPGVGDHYVYDIGPYSVIIARTAESEIKAFINSCTHRGTRILGEEGAGFAQGFSCPFHGWSWHLDGRLKDVPGRWDFPHVCEATHSLQPVACDAWEGFVFINLDPDASPLIEQLDVLPEHFTQFPLADRRIRLHVQKELPANWKAAQEAFMEAYHNFTTHDSPTGANTQYDIFGPHVSRFIHNIGHYSPEALSDYPGDKWRKPELTEQELLAGLPVEQRPLSANETARAAGAQMLRDAMATQLGRDFSAVSDSVMLDSIEYHLFPNAFFFPGMLISMAYRFRPLGDDVDRCLFEIVMLEPLADGATHPDPPEPVYLNAEQSYTEIDELAWLGAVYDQDTGNLLRQQQGLKTTRKGITLGNYQEARIRRFHLTLDGYLGNQKAT
ncbi:MAG: aromatic ring-hydroxylating dioxygenase subunit alpha [Halieaceae bacterium]|jgi:nitrite reductase/ring-hydroxylating ferredoxin subunit|nr:aromatic ring-hydroxylating dioxygenase subunit alpha [Halieaceae bacterium]